MSTGVTKPSNQSAGATKPANQRAVVTKPVNQTAGVPKQANQNAGKMKAAMQKNAYAPVKIDPDSDYMTPGAFELEQLFRAVGGAEYTHVNEVWPRIFIGDEKTALERPQLEAMGMTHILNVAEGKWNNVATGARFYHGMNVRYYGIEAEDTPTFNLAEFFYPAADFMHQTLNHPESRLLVHCVMGRSRSATLVLAYLMIHERLSVVDAITHVRHRRCVLPNRGFIKQLRALDITLQQERHTQRIGATDTEQKSVRQRERERKENDREKRGRERDGIERLRKGNERERE